MKRTILFAFCVLVAAKHVYGDFAKLESFLERENLWETTPDSFLANQDDQIFFQWLSSKKDSAKYPGYKNSPQVTFLGKKCWEVVAKFEEGKLSAVTISLYNRGDAGDIDDKAEYLKMFEKISGDIEKWAGEKCVMLPELRLANGKKLKKKVWVKNNSSVIELRWSASENIIIEEQGRPEKTNRVKFRAEYIQFALTPFNPQNDPRKSKTPFSPAATATINKAGSAKQLKENVQKDGQGYVFIENLPMVDQGEKGYCAVATAQRILEYYGVNVDEHVIAQIANTGTKGGTNAEEMFEMIKQLGTKFGVKVNIIIGFDIQKFIIFVNDYNQSAKKYKKKEIILGRVIDVSAVYDAMDDDVLKITRNRDKIGSRKFFSDIIKHTDAGIPLAWSVVLGKVPENPPLPQASGGHMRIIFGYNKDTNEIVYSDSWSVQHERKTMNLDDAWAITTGLYSIDPKKK